LIKQYKKLILTNCGTGRQEHARHLTLKQIERLEALHSPNNGWILIQRSKKGVEYPAPFFDLYILIQSIAFFLIQLYNSGATRFTDL
jgi:hypothetical protein